MDVNLQAVHEIQREDAERHPAQQDSTAGAAVQASQQPGGGAASSRGLLELLASWAGAARRSVGSLLASLQSAFFNYCRQRECWSPGGTGSVMPALGCCLHAPHLRPNPPPPPMKFWRSPPPTTGACVPSPL